MKSINEMLLEAEAKFAATKAKADAMWAEAKRSAPAPVDGADVDEDYALSEAGALHAAWMEEAEVELEEAKAHITNHKQ